MCKLIKCRILCLFVMGCLSMTNASELKADANKNEWVFHVYDLNPLIEEVPQYEDIYFRSRDFRSPENKKEDLNVDALIDVLKDATGPENWMADQATLRVPTARVIKGMLYVNQQESVHTRIRQVLSALVREKKTQVRVQVRIVKSTGLDRTQLSTLELIELVAKAGADADANQTQVVCYNGQSAVTFGGREESYMETFVANTEGGGNVSGAREASSSPILEGLTAIVRPLIVADSGSVELTLRLVLINNVSFRKLAAFERESLDLVQSLLIPGDSPKSGSLKTNLSDNDHAELFRMPSRESSRLLTQVVVPKGKWVLAGTITGPAKDKKLLHVFVSAEVVEP